MVYKLLKLPAKVELIPAEVGAHRLLINGEDGAPAVVVRDSLEAILKLGIRIAGAALAEMEPPKAVVSLGQPRWVVYDAKLEQVRSSWASAPEAQAELVELVMASDDYVGRYSMRREVSI